MPYLSFFSSSSSSFSISNFTPHMTLTLLVTLLSLTAIRQSHCQLDNYGDNAAASPPAVHPKNSRHRQMAVDYYAKSCPQVEKLIGSITYRQFQQFPVSAPATIRLFFHDCFVEGCDGSILIATEAGSKEAAEKDASDNKDLAAEAFDTVNMAKVLVESHCPGVVSCADILAISARDFVHLAGGPYYEVEKGRWDGKISKASHVASHLPHANSTLDSIITLFASKGLKVNDLVALSGAHTIGFSHCRHLINRIYDYKGTKQPQPQIDPRLLKALKMSCPQYGGNADIVVPFDVTTPFSFDNAYYGNLKKNMGLLATDQALYMDPRTRPIVEAHDKDSKKFFQAFSQAMQKMGLIGVKRGKRHGEKRKICSLHSSSIMKNLERASMATPRVDMKGYYKQQKKNAGISKSTKSSKQKNPSSHSATFGSDVAQPPALVSHGGSLDLQDEYDGNERILRDFDMNMAYGPCLGMSRAARWERADRLGLNPPEDVKTLLTTGGVNGECLWDGRV
ncbi:hypothetical protein V2J09_019502 [Rumex salicifolius]